MDAASQYDILSDQNRLQPPREDGSSWAPSTMPSVPGWLHKLPSSTSGYSVTGPPSLNDFDGQGERNSTSGLRPTQNHPAQPFRPAQPASSAQSIRNTEARRAPPPRTVLQDMPRRATESTRGSEVESISQRDQQRTQPNQSVSCDSFDQQPLVAKTQGRSLYSPPLNQHQPSFSGQSPIVNNFDYNYSPVDSRQNITTNNQKYYFDNGFHQTINAPTHNHTYNNQNHNVDNSRRDITQSKNTIQTGPMSEPKSQNAAELRGRAPSETIPLRGTRIKCNRGLFIGKTISTHQHVVDDRPC